MNTKILIVLMIVFVMSVEFTESAYRRGGGSRGGSRSGGRSSRTSRSRSSGGSTTRRKFSPAGTSRVTKYTHIPVYTSKSPVIVPQTKLGTRSNLGRNIFIGYMFYRYGLHTAPVYRHRYPIHRTTVEIPEERAVRVNFTKEIMLDSSGNVCLNSSKDYTLVADMNERVSFVTTEVRYSDLNGGLKKVYSGDNKTVIIDMNALDQSVEVSTLVKYNGTIVANTNCTQIQSVMNGTVVRMYATNPVSTVNVRSTFPAVVLSSCGPFKHHLLYSVVLAFRILLSLYSLGI